MKKFESDKLELGVIRCATPSLSYLNRQIIVLLSCLGVPDEVFLDLQQEALDRLDTHKIVKGLKKLIMQVI